MCRLKDPSKRNENKRKVKNYKKFLLKSARASKANRFNKFFIENKWIKIRLGKESGRFLIYIL